MFHHGILRTALLCVALSVPAAPVGAAIHHPGRWSNSFRWTKPGTSQPLAEAAVNMMLLPMPDTVIASVTTPRARVLWWQDDHEHNPEIPPDTSFGGFWNWLPGADSTLNSGAFPDATVPGSGALSLYRYPSPLYNIFCSGMAQLDDDLGWGRALIVGGTSEAENGSTISTIYNARTNSWTRTATGLAWGRWYPSVTMLPGGNGKALVTSGSRYKEGWLFGGGPATDLVYREPFSYETALQWNADLLPDSAAVGVTIPPSWV